MSLRNRPVKQEASDTGEIPVDEFQPTPSTAGEPKPKRRKRVFSTNYVDCNYRITHP